MTVNTLKISIFDLGVGYTGFFDRKIAENAYLYVFTLVFDHYLLKNATRCKMK